MSDTNDRIRQRVEAFVDELSELVRTAALESVQEALLAQSGGAAAPASRPRRSINTPTPGTASANKAPRARKSRSKGAKRSPEELLRARDAFLDAVKADPGLGIEALAKQIGFSTKDLALPVRKLLGEGLIHKKGEKRATRYYPGKRRGK